MILQVVIQEHVVEGVLDGVEWSRPVIVSAQNPDLQEGVLRDAVMDHLFLADIAAPGADGEGPGGIDFIVRGNIRSVCLSGTPARLQHSC